ncbi:PTS sugar transporter subunit IIB [uncultured Dubosiella sp.]|uniref:PTS sugar transporter subunit IIB n=1 Tax=uncultured Dubosiella sp. TaxID=1937011 RepID=UPI00259BBED6|nr:PTS sugar transporter subunit IIB [uncultured Dubosiella sp.]
MIKAAICCGGGFSSSTMAERIRKGIKHYGLESELSIDFCPFLLASKKIEAYDIFILCPHLSRDVKRFNERYCHDRKPLYVLPIRMYGPVDVQELYWDLIDLLALFAKHPVNPVHFPGEENALKIRRITAYRHQNR